MISKYRNWIIVIVTGSLPVGVWLVFNELQSPGFCPPYPGLGFPACYIVPVFFLLVLASQFVRKPWFNKLLFHLGALPGLFTAVWFSVHQASGKAQCPQLFSIPLCYAALAVFLVLITLHQVRCIDEGTCELPR